MDEKMVQRVTDETKEKVVDETKVSKKFCPYNGREDCKGCMAFSQELTNWKETHITETERVFDGDNVVGGLSEEPTGRVIVGFLKYCKLGVFSRSAEPFKIIEANGKVTEVKK